MRVVMWGVGALVLVGVAAFSSLWARQVVAEHAAASSYQSARDRVATDLQRARAGGIFGWQFRGIVSAVSAIEGAPPPAGGFPWNTSQERFYRQQGSALSGLDARLRVLVQRLTAQARARAHASLWTYARAVRHAHYDGLTVRWASAQVQVGRARLAAAHTAAGFRGLVRWLQPRLSALRARTGARDSALGAIVQSVQPSSDPAAAVRALASSRVSAAEDDLAMMRLLRRPGRYGQQLNRLARWAARTQTAHWAAVAMVDLSDLATRIHDRYRAVAPTKWILVSTEGQWARMYEGTQVVYSTLVTTGGPQLPTDHGYFHIYEKITPFVFHSPWPPGSQYWYPDSPVTYWMPFDQAEGLHDAPWRSDFGPGSNYLPTPGTEIDGTHGCVNLPLDAAQFVWDWAPVGTPVIVE